VSFYLIPIVGITAGALFLGERFDPRQLIGAVVVLAAVLAIIRLPSMAAGQRVPGTLPRVAPEP
jgi:drug/metabolite transporter (DMT)-like permease